MKERPIILNNDMVRAVLDGRKTQTRRIMKVQPSADFSPMNMELETDFTARWYTPGVADKDGYLQPAKKQVFGVASEDEGYACPFGAVGDRLWVRETSQAVEHESGLDVVRYPADGNEIPVKAHPLDAGRWVDLYRYRGGEGKIVPSIHMPRWASRITLEITGVRVERLTALSDDDARNEGCPAQLPHNPEDEHQARTWFRGLWSEIYGADSWQANPWVWVIEFKRVEGE
ncbi:hypothetical protein LU196_13010 [Pantoea sp. Mb-10]|uniref:hypothetical protein n=1 Tax=unclassified Pantoea TaxID=2630326 RepID=UPI001E29603E|nr:MULTISPECIES: hypothetical protein [unclassified Pantoea]MCE0490959.1 hypothetical protein [Pantoea sp. Mb-10]MCE0499883.1 hypothetical protein [Pantoea sp. Pb-8]